MTYRRFFRIPIYLGFAFVAAAITLLMFGGSVLLSTAASPTSQRTLDILNTRPVLNAHHPTHGPAHHSISGTPMPTPNLGLSQPAVGSCGDVSINGGVSTPVGTITHISWNWGDGVIANSWFPASHRYSTNGSYTIEVTAHSSVGTTATRTTLVNITDAGGEYCTHTVLVFPSTVVLSKGKTSERLRIALRDNEGRIISLAGRPISYVSSNPSVIQVNPSGTVISTGFGEAQIEVTVAGIPNKGTASAMAGEFRIEPPILLLSPGSHATGQLSLITRNADGSPLDLTGRQVTYRVENPTSNPVANVNSNGLVTAIRPPGAFNETPIISASIDNVYARNIALVRVTSASLSLTMQSYSGEHISIFAAPQVGSFPFGQLIMSLQAVQVNEGMYSIQRRVTGITPFRGDAQYFVMDPGVDDTVPCGLSGNPARFGIRIDNFALGNCFGGTNFLHWGVMGHELGHNFMSFDQRALYDVAWELPNGVTYMEGIATMLGMYALDEMIKNPARYGLSASTIDNLRDPVALGPAFARQVWYPKLAKYEANPDYANEFDADLLDAIMLQLHDEFGPSFFFRFMSALSPADKPLPITFSTEGQRLAFWAAACSAAARADLKSRFQTRWAMPIDSDFYDQILPMVRNLAAQRDSSRAFDFDGDGRADISVRRPSDDFWYLQRSTDGFTGFQWGIEGDKMAPADFDGDGKTDIAVFRPAEGAWYVIMSESQTFQAFSWGVDGDLPVPADHDGDGRADLVVYRNTDNTFYKTSVTASFFEGTQFGVDGDRPQIGDFDADGKADVAVFRPSDNNWYVLRSSGGFTAQQFGEAGDVPVPADYDGDGATDPAVYRPSTGVWYRLRSTSGGGYDAVEWGIAGDIPAPADYDGDGKADPAVFRPSEGVWYLHQTTAGLAGVQFGQAGDVPTPSSFIH